MMSFFRRRPGETQREFADRLDRRARLLLVICLVGIIWCTALLWWAVSR